MDPPHLPIEERVGWVGLGLVVRTGMQGSDWMAMLGNGRGARQYCEQTDNNIEVNLACFVLGNTKNAVTTKIPNAMNYNFISKNLKSLLHAAV